MESAACRGPRIWLAEADDSGDLAVFDLTALLSDPSFGLPDGGRVCGCLSWVCCRP
ncbi:hypothetical protein Q3A86_36440 [Streptomyces sp. NBUA17]|uniref:hypothetical protein n=1 Tax=Streptomyces sp. NBUA17 TaxID=3062275 RepID=UPI0037D9AC02